MVGVRILQILVIIIILGVIVYLLRLSRALKYEKRLARFAVSGVEEKEVAILDKLGYYIGLLNRRLTKVLKKSVVLNKYGERYNKYISYENRNKKTGLDYVSGKFLLSLLVIALLLISVLFNKIKFDLMVFLIVFLVSFFIPDIFLSIEYKKKRKKVEEDLLKAIIIMNNAFQSGRNIMQAILVVKNELDGPIQDEFKKIYLDMTYGLSLEVVFNRFYERVKLEEAKYITSSLSLLNKTGGDIVKVFSLIERTFLDKKNLKNELLSLTSSSQFVFKLLLFLPLVFILVIFVLNPSYFAPLFTSFLGIIILILTSLLYILYILVVKKVLEVEI